MLRTPQIPSPKRTKKTRLDWHGFSPYYAGFSEDFAQALISNSGLATGSIVHDPWNGSGTTTHAASMRDLPSIGFDLNPVMVVVAKARLLSPTEADSVEPLGLKILSQAKDSFAPAEHEDPLLSWFGKSNAGRSLEFSIREHLVGPLTLGEVPVNLDHLSSLAAVNYVALFSVCREMAKRFQSTNPTWLRYPRSDEQKPRYSNASIRNRYLQKLKEMAKALDARRKSSVSETVATNIRVADTTNELLPANSIDLVLTSPPYCTRIDYTAATRVELALLAPLAEVRVDELSSKMIGSIRVPRHEIEISPIWGQTCANFLRKLHVHPSKASGGYYYRTHLDYFDKMSRSIANLTHCLKPKRNAIFVIQDSYYKEIYNGMPPSFGLYENLCAA